MTRDSSTCTSTHRSGPLAAVTSSERRDGSTVRLVGDLDLATASLFASTIDHELGLGRRFLTIDLAQLEFLDCTGLRALVDARTRTLAAGGTFVLTGVGPRAAWLLDATGLDATLVGRT